MDRKICHLRVSGSFAGRRVAVPRFRPISMEMDAPRGWRDWAGAVLRRRSHDQGRVRYIARHAVVIAEVGRWVNLLDADPAKR